MMLAISANAASNRPAGATTAVSEPSATPTIAGTAQDRRT